MHGVTTADIQVVTQLVKRVAAVKYHRAKKDLFLREVSELPEAATRLLTFCCWFCLFNPRFKFVDPSRYYFIPTSKDNTSTFGSFLSVVQFYENKRITRNREGELCKFLATCDKEHKEFYLLLISRAFTSNLPMMELQMSLDIDQFSTDQLYSPVAPLVTGLHDMAYPVAVRTIPSGRLPIVVLAKEPHGSYFCEIVGGKLARRKTPEGLLRDVAYSYSPRFAVMGYFDQQSGVLYPINLYPSLKAVRNYLKGTDEELCLGALDSFKRDNLLTSVDLGAVIRAYFPTDWGRVLKQVVGSSTTSKLLVFDESTGRGVQAHYIDVRLAHGVVEDLWQQEGNPTGFKVWFNGELRDCSYDFYGRENALLSSISLVKNKRVSFYYVKVGGASYLMGNAITWNTPTWRTSRLRGARIWIEKCVFCGRTDHKHESRGLCHSCYHALFNLFSKYAKDTWIRQTAPRARAQEENCWEPELLNVVNYQHQGYVLKANSKGEWGFFSDEEAMKKYNQFKDKQR